MLTGRGIEGEIYRRNQTGVDALTRAMTGAGLNLTEIANYGSRYQIDPLRDNAEIMGNKLEDLGRDLKAVIGLVDKGGDPEQVRTALRRYLDKSGPKPAADSPEAGPAPGGARAPQQRKTATGVGWSIVQ